MSFLQSLVVYWDKITRDSGADAKGSGLARMGVLDYWFSEGNCENLLKLYNALENAESRDTLAKVVAFNLAHFYNDNAGDFNFYTEEQWREFARRARTIPCLADEPDSAETFALEGYSYGDLVRARSGDTVFDCGAYTGNTPIYFSRRVGDSGEVFCFEPSIANYRELENNIQKFSLRNARAHRMALGDKNGEASFVHDGWASRVSQSGESVPIKTIDSFVKENGVEKVNFIKMDIEGSELDALSGAKETIRNCGPDLAICVYHRPSDLLDIPQKIREISPSYQFYLRHNSIYFSETVLFARRGDAPRPLVSDDGEARALTAWWRAIRKTTVEKTATTKKRLLELYCASLQALKPLPVEPVFGGNYYFAKIPISMDQYLHFEFLFPGGRAEKVEIALHFEGKYESAKNLAREIIQRSELTLPIRETGRGCSYILDDAQDYKTASRIMAYLISISIPALKKHRMIDNLAFFENKGLLV